MDVAYDYAEQAKMMKAFCDENRLKILAQLRGGEQCACRLLDHLEIGQSALSYHMKILIESGVVESRECGKWTHYRLSAQGSARAIAAMQAILTPNERAEGKARHGASCGCAVSDGTRG
ncbi:MAG: winged helix-turn-helix transcriptional regulator [Clostridiales bacterium]|nr:winged helix-turn-helix transcriptional regulator [Clostridiales bacterium]